MNRDSIPTRLSTTSSSVVQSTSHRFAERSRNSLRTATRYAWLLLLASPLAAAEPGASSSADNDSAMRAVVDTGGVLLFDGSSPVLYYQRERVSLGGNWPRSNYVHPLYGLDGAILTEDFPEDHGHHRGVFWAWHQVWVGDQMIGDPWVCRDFVWDVADLQTISSPDAINLLADVFWKSPQYKDENGAMTPIVREQTVITARQSQPEYRVVDFKIALRALVDDVKIGGSDDIKGYGGFSPRIKLDESTRFLAPSGEIEPRNTAIVAGDRVNIVSDRFGLAILTHSQNPGEHQSYILRASGSMQNAVYPGRRPVALSTTHPTVLRYRLVIHRGELDPETIESLSEAFQSK